MLVTAPIGVAHAGETKLMTLTTAVETPPAELPASVTLFDADVHTIFGPDVLLPYLEDRWKDYVREYGLRTRHEADMAPLLRPWATRADADPPGGGLPGSDPAFSRAHHLDVYGIDFAILNSIPGQAMLSGGNSPVVLCEALERANNDWHLAEWLEDDPRWLASIACQFDNPALAAKEVRRCMSMSDRFVQILASTRTDRPFGHSNYEPLLEVAVEFDLPIAFHPGGTGMHQITGSGWPSYYFENHCSYPLGALSHLSSLVFEGAFERWPQLKIVMVEAGWSWFAPYAWRLDNTFETLRSEVPHLTRRPSEYLAEHVWFTSQPVEEPLAPATFSSVYAQLVETVGPNKLMYSSDYPHWDFDSPTAALPRDVGEETRRAIMAENANALYRPLSRRPASAGA
jgi:predicted TIM-barrel fold metal-dependent hydrolase